MVLIALLLLRFAASASFAPTVVVPSHHQVASRCCASPLSLARGRRGRGGPPERRIVRDGFGNPIERSGGRGRGERGRGRGGRGRGGSQSPTPRPSVGDVVSVVEKANYGTDIRTSGTVSRVLTRAMQHPRGFKVRLTCGTVGRCTELIRREVRRGSESESQPPITSSSGEPSVISESDAYLESLDLTPPAPGQRLRDSERS